MGWRIILIPLSQENILDSKTGSGLVLEGILAFQEQFLMYAMFLVVSIAGE